MEHDIKLSTDTPVCVKQYPLPYSMMQAEGDEVRSMIELGVIEGSESPYCSPVIIVKKKGNTNLFCIDFRVLKKSQSLMQNQCLVWNKSLQSLLVTSL